jgi:hypothetical protein
VTDEVGANCVIAAATPPPAYPPGKEPTPRPRFQEGARDEVRGQEAAAPAECGACCRRARGPAVYSGSLLKTRRAPHPLPGRQVSILAPELGPLAAALVAPEGGSWVLDELNVSSSRTNHIDRFVCRHQLGGRRGEGAAYLTPVPPGAVVYGSGDSARILTKVRRGGGVFGWGGEQGWGGCAGSERPGSALRAAAGEGSRSVAALTGAPASLRPLARPRPRRARPRRSRPPRCAARASMSTQT